MSLPCSFVLLLMILCVVFMNMDTIQQEKILEKVKQFTLFDDDYIKTFFNEDISCTQFVLRTILKKDDLVITKSKAQE